MSRDSPTLDEIYGPGAEAADGWAGHLDELADRAAALEQQTRSIYEKELTDLWEKNCALEGQLEGAGEEIDRLKQEITNLRATSAAPAGSPYP